MIVRHRASAWTTRTRALPVIVTALALGFMLMVPLAAVAPRAAHAAEATAQPVIASAEAIVETQDGTVLFQKNADTSVPMASTTKIMTAVVALESGLPLDTTYTVSELAVSNQSTVAGYVAGETVTLWEMLQALMTHSAGDAADGIAECVAGSRDAFVTLMNQKASELGMTGTHYTSPDGFSDDGHYSTPADLVLLARHAMQIPSFRTIVGSKSVTVTVAGTPTTFTNTNVFLDDYPGMLGVKTGFTYGAGYCFVGCVTRGGVTVYTCVLGAPSEDDRISDTRALMDWAFAQLPASTLLESDARGAALGYLTSGYHYGLVARTVLSENATARAATSGVTVTGLALTASDQALMADVVSTVTWYTLGSVAPVCTRTVTAVPTTSHAQTYGPFIAPLFYDLDANGAA